MAKITNNLATAAMVTTGSRSRRTATTDRIHGTEGRTQVQVEPSEVVTMVMVEATTTSNPLAIIITEELTIEGESTAFPTEEVVEVVNSRDRSTSKETSKDQDQPPQMVTGNQGQIPEAEISTLAETTPRMVPQFRISQGNHFHKEETLLTTIGSEVEVHLEDSVDVVVVEDVGWDCDPDSRGLEGTNPTLPVRLR